MPNLAEQLRAYVDAAPPVALDQIADKPRRRHRTVLMALAAVTCVALAVAGLRLTRTNHPDHQLRTTTIPQSLDQCVTAPGCAMNRATASRHTGFPIRLPMHIPEGWVQTSYANLRVYPPHSQLDGRAPQHTVLVYGVIWAPPRTDLTSGCPNKLSVRQRRAEPFDWPGNIDLGNGLVVSGSVDFGVCGNPGGRMANFAHFNWLHNGVYYSLDATGLARDEIVRVIRSFDE